MKLKVENPDKKFGDVLRLAGKMKKQGVEITKYIGAKTQKAVKKINKSMKKVVKNLKKNKRKTMKKA